MDSSIKDLETKIDALASYSKSNFESIFEILASFNNQFSHIKKELSIINTKIDNLDGDTSKNFTTVDSKLDDLGEKISQINKVTGFEDILNNAHKLY